jgi:predicted HTH domain antitoxin
MDLFDLQATITLDTNDYERSIGEAMRSAAQFGAGIAEAGGNVQEFAEGVLSGLSDGLREAADAGADISALDDAIASAAEGFANGTESAEEFLGKLGQIGTQAGSAVDPVSELGDEAMNAGDAQDSAGDATAFFGDMIKANLTGDIIKKAISMVKELVVESAQYGDTIDKQSQKLGISASAYQQWEAVLEHSGSSMSSMSFTFKTLANAAQDATDDQVAAFERLGMSMDEVKNMSTEDIFANVISGLQNMEEGTERTAIATDLLGRGAMELGPLLNTSAEDTQAMLDRVEELGGVMSDDGVKAAAAYQDAVQDFSTAFQAAARDIATAVLPVLTDIINGATDAMAAMRNVGVDEAIDQYDSYIDKIKAARENVDKWKASYDAAVEAMVNPQYSAQGWANAQEQLNEVMAEMFADPEAKQEFFDMINSGEISAAEAAEVMGISVGEMRAELQQTIDATSDMADGAEEVEEAFDAEAEAAQEVHDSLVDIASEAIDAKYSGDDLSETYDRLSREFESVKDSGDEALVALTQQKLAQLQLAATNQKLTSSYPALVNQLRNSYGYSVTELSGWLIDNGMTAEEWGNQVNSATGNVINGFQTLDTSLDMSLDEMASSMQTNIEAYANWNDNIATLMQAAVASGDSAAIAFVQYMQDMGIGAADQVAMMVGDIDGTLATFGPMMGDAIDQGMLSVYNGIEGADLGTPATGVMDDAIAAVDAANFTQPGQQKASDLATGFSSNAYMVSSAASSAMTSARNAAYSGANQFYDVGYQMDMGMVRGLQSGMNAVVRMAQSVAKEAYRAARQSLGIGSTNQEKTAVYEGEVFQRSFGSRTINNYFTVNGAEDPEMYANSLMRELNNQMRMA